MLSARRLDEIRRYSPARLYVRTWNRTFDLMHGVATRSVTDVSARTSCGEGYEASPVYTFRRLLRRLEIDFVNYTFVDFGSGKGRALLLAGELPFRQVIGVESSAALNDLAIQNISAYRRRSAQRVVSLHCDAAEFELPVENLVLYFFNPFNADALSRVVANISTSLERTPREVIVIYLNLRNPELLEKLPGVWHQAVWEKYRIYTYSPVAA
jgi:SAM-dependent methyltransferase